MPALFNHLDRNHWRRVFVSGLFVILVAVLLAVLVPTVTAQGVDSQWFAQYFNNANLNGTPVLERYENDINNEWGERFPPAPGVNRDEFSVRWTRRIDFPTTGTYRFSATMDDGMRVFVDDRIVIDAWNLGPRRTLSTNVHLTAGPHLVRAEFFDQVLNATAIFNWEQASPGLPIDPPINNWRGEYYNNQDLSGEPVVVRDDGRIEFDWGFAAPAGPINADRFSVRWERSLNLDPGLYRFTTATDDGVRLWVDGQLLIDQWHRQALTTYSAEVQTDGRPLRVRMEYFELAGLAEAHLNWVPLSTTPAPTPPPSSAPPAQGTATVAVDLANVRQGPSTSFSIINTFSEGMVLELAGYRTADNLWVQVFLPNGTRGWTYAPLWNLSVPLSSLPVRTDGGFPNGPYATVVGAAHLNVRSGPGLDFAPFTTISGNMVVELHGRDIAGDWIYVRLRDGRYGWSSSAYLQTSVPVNSLPIVD